MGYSPTSLVEPEISYRTVLKYYTDQYVKIQSVIRYHPCSNYKEIY